MDIAFLGFSAVQKDIGLMVPDLQDAAVKKALLKKARKKVAVIDHSKLDKLSFVKVRMSRQRGTSGQCFSRTLVG